MVHMCAYTDGNKSQHNDLEYTLSHTLPQSIYGAEMGIVKCKIGNF